MVIYFCVSSKVKISNDYFFLQVLINGLQHFVSINVKPKLQVVETFIKVTISIALKYFVYVVQDRIWDIL